MNKQHVSTSLSEDLENARLDELSTPNETSYAPGRVTLVGVRKEFGNVTAVEHASLSIKNGEFVTIVGPSGCGKTTTLRIIAGFETPTSGSVGIAGMDVTEKPPNQRNVGMVFQDFALFNHMTVAENVAYGLKADGRYDRETIDSRVKEMLELVELPEYGERMPDQLSGGQQQRIALARSLAKQPDVLLLDEPLASLDKQLRESMQVELRRIQQEVGITTILVTHNQREALTMSDRIAVMKDGTFEQVGTPQTIYERPASSFVADFVGTANIFNGTVAARCDDEITLDCDGQSIQVIDEEAAVEPGDDASVVIRPEDVVIETTPGTAAGTTFDGTVGITRYTGDKVEYHVKTDNDQTVVVTEEAKTGTFAMNDRVSVTIPPKDGLVVSE